MIFNRRVRRNSNRETRENREQKRECPLLFQKAEKQSVRYKSNRERREKRESFYGLFLLVRTLPVVRGS